MKNTQRPPFSAVELQVQASASRRARKQLMAVPWDRFRKAYEEYPEWQGLSLWIRAVLALGRDALPVVLNTLRKRCPGFLEMQSSAPEPNLLAFQLIGWANNTVFAYAKREGWLDALTFYGVRHVRSEAFWTFWEHCEIEWSGTPRKRKTVPPFTEWREQALKGRICGPLSYSGACRTLERYIDWEATAWWLLPLLASDAKPPKHVVRALERRLPGASLQAETHEGKGAKWRSRIRAALQGCLHKAAGERCYGSLANRARRHPWHIRLTVYGKLWEGREAQKTARHYPPFRQWRTDAERYMSRGACPPGFPVH